MDIESRAYEYVLPVLSKLVVCCCLQNVQYVKFLIHQTHSMCCLISFSKQHYKLKGLQRDKHSDLYTFVCSICIYVCIHSKLYTHWIHGIHRLPAEMRLPYFIYLKNYSLLYVLAHPSSKRPCTISIIVNINVGICMIGGYFWDTLMECDVSIYIDQFGLKFELFSSERFSGRWVAKA